MTTVVVVHEKNNKLRINVLLFILLLILLLRQQYEYNKREGAGASKREWGRLIGDWGWGYVTERNANDKFYLVLTPSIINLGSRASVFVGKCLRVGCQTVMKISPREQNRVDSTFLVCLFYFFTQHMIWAPLAWLLFTAPRRGVVAGGSKKGKTTRRVTTQGQNKIKYTRTKKKYFRFFHSINEQAAFAVVAHRSKSR